MKTLNDLIELVGIITRNNDGKLIQFLVSLDIRYKRLSLISYADTIEYDEDKDEYVTKVLRDEQIFNSLYFETTEGLQLAYWTLYNACINRVEA